MKDFEIAIKDYVEEVTVYHEKVIRAIPPKIKLVRITSADGSTKAKTAPHNPFKNYKPVTTPLGTFPSVGHAALAHGVSKSILSHRVNSQNHPGYYHVRKETVGS